MVVGPLLSNVGCLAAHEQRQSRAQFPWAQPQIRVTPAGKPVRDFDSFKLSSIAVGKT
jgi:hypothetical protein